jgi:hypothetical protein
MNSLGLMVDTTIRIQKVTVNVEYVSDKRAITRTLITTQMVTISLPVAVNVQDYFRETRYHFEQPLKFVVLTTFHRLFSRFTASTTTDQYVRIASAQLDTDGADLEGVQIVGCQAHQKSVVGPIPPLSSAQLIQSEDHHSCSASEFLVLPRVRAWSWLVFSHYQHGQAVLIDLISARILDSPPQVPIASRRSPIFCQESIFLTSVAEVEYLIGATVEETIRAELSLSPYRDTLVSRLVSALQSNAIWEEHYRVTGELIIPDITMEDDDQLCQTLARIQQVRTTSNLMAWDQTIFLFVEIMQRQLPSRAGRGMARIQNSR